MKSFVFFISMFLFSLNQIVAQKYFTLPKYLVYSDVTSHLKGNRSANIGFQKNGIYNSVFFEADMIYGYAFSDKVATKFKNNTQLTEGVLNYGVTLGYKSVISDFSTKKVFKGMYLGGKASFSKLNYDHIQLVPTKSTSAEKPKDVCNCGELMESNYSTTNQRTDVAVQLGYQTLFKSGLYLDFSVGSGVSLNIAEVTTGKIYANAYCDTNDTYNDYSNKGNKLEKIVTLNKNGNAGFSPLLLTQMSVKVGWALSRPSSSRKGR